VWRSGWSSFCFSPKIKVFAETVLCTPRTIWREVDLAKWREVDLAKINLANMAGRFGIASMTQDFFLRVVVKVKESEDLLSLFLQSIELFSVLAIHSIIVQYFHGSLSLVPHCPIQSIS